MLTKELLQRLPPETIFAMGVTIDGPGHCNVANTGSLIKWVAVRGMSPHWSVFVDNPYMPQMSFEGVKRLGDKVHDEQNIKGLVPCDDAALALYNH